MKLIYFCGSTWTRKQARLLKKRDVLVNKDAFRLIIVSQKVREIFAKHRVHPKYDYIPIR